MNETLLAKAEEVLITAGYDLSKLKYRVRKPAEWVGGNTMKNNQQVWDRQSFLDQCNGLGTTPYTLHVEDERGLDVMTLKYTLPLEVVTFEDLLQDPMD